MNLNGHKGGFGTEMGMTDEQFVDEFIRMQLGFVKLMTNSPDIVNLSGQDYVSRGGPWEQLPTNHFNMTTMTKEEYIEKIIDYQVNYLVLSIDNGEKSDEIRKRVVSELTPKLERLELRYLAKYYEVVKETFESLLIRKQEENKQREDELYKQILNDYVFKILPEFEGDYTFFVIDDVGFNIRNFEESAVLANRSLLMDVKASEIRKHLENIAVCQVERGKLVEVPSVDFFNEFETKVSGLSNDKRRKLFVRLFKILRDLHVEIQQAQQAEQESLYNTLLGELQAIDPNAELSSFGSHIGSNSLFDEGPSGTYYPYGSGVTYRGSR